MPEDTKPTDGVKVEIGGKEYTLRYTLSALKAAKQAFGGSILKLETLKTLDEDNLGKLLWFGLRAHHPELTIEEIEDNIDFPMLPYLMQKFGDAVSASLPDAPKNDQSPATETNRAARPKVTKISTGSSSGQSELSTSDSKTVSFGA